MFYTYTKQVTQLLLRISYLQRFGTTISAMNNQLCSSRINFLLWQYVKICKEMYSRSKSDDPQGMLRKILLIRLQRALYRSVNVQIRDQRSLLFVQHLTIINRKLCFNGEYEVHCMGVLRKFTTCADKTKYRSGIVCVRR
jgi:hypothetical protein